MSTTRAYISFDIRWEKPVVEFLSGGWTGLTRDEVIRAIGELVNPIRVKIIFTIINALTVTTTINFLRRSTVANFRHFPDQCSVHGSKERPLAFPQLFIPLPQLPRKQQVRKITQKVQINRELKE